MHLSVAGFGPLTVAAIDGLDTEAFRAGMLAGSCTGSALSAPLSSAAPPRPEDRFRSNC